MGTRSTMMPLWHVMRGGIVTDNLEAEWRFDEGAGASVEDHVGSANLTIGGSGSDWVSGGLEFNGAAYAQNATAPVLAPPPLTHVICCYLDPGAVAGLTYIMDGGNATARHVLGDDNGGGHTHDLLMSGGTILYGGANTTPIGKWVILTVIFNGASGIVYDGVTELMSGDVGTRTLDGITLAARYTLASFMPYAIWGYHLIYTAALTPAQISKNNDAITAIMAQRGVAV